MNKPSKLYVEQLPGGNYGVKETHDKKPIVTARTQEKAIEKAKQIDPKELLIERVRHTDRGGRDKWRKA
jgi:hypothetical protein